ncbi:hypothetical protein K437DRAFT_216480, partial [Tilletiaria anomala UBC 951]
SDLFCQLTGYSKENILRRNCQFLKSPTRDVIKGNVPQYTDHAAVAHLKRKVLRRKEFQASFLNYSKDGTLFINLVTVIPIHLLDYGETTHLVGFQVHLTRSPGAVLKQPDNGSYVVDH